MIRRFNKPFTGRFVAIVLAVSLAVVSALVDGCRVGPKYNKPSTPAPPAYKELTPDQFKETDGWKIAQPRDDALRGKWWELFKDADLNRLEDQVNVNNQNIAQAEATYRAAHALVRQARSQYFPTVTAGASASASRFPSGAGRGNSGAGGTGGGNSSSPSTGSSASNGSANSANTSSSSNVSSSFSIPFNATWEPDLWGRVHNTVAANAYQSQAVFADLENVRLSMYAELAVDYFQLRGLDSQKQLLDSIVASYQQALDLTQVLYNVGMVSEEDVSQARSQLETARAQAIDVGVLRSQFEHAIAVFVGTPPSSFAIAAQPLSSEPPAIPFGVPSELLERRPDIAAAERRVAAANAQIGVAKAAYYPALNLTAGGGFVSSMIGNLISWPSRFWSVGASLAQTLFDGGLRRAVTEQARAVYDETVATYRQTVLTAFQGVEDNLSTLRILSQEKQQQQLAVAASQRTLELATERYRTGIDSYLNVITAQNTLYTNERTAVTIRTDQMVASVQLILALGGGWDASQLPSD